MGDRDAGRQGLSSVFEVAVWRRDMEGGRHGKGVPIPEAKKHWGEREVSVSTRSMTEIALFGQNIS